MSECKDERMGLGGNPGQPSLKIPLSSIKTIIQMIKCAFDIPEIPLPYISAKEIALSGRFRPGVSKTDTVSRVLNKKNAANIDTGPNADGTPNKSNAKDRIMVEEIMDELMYKAKIEIAFDIGSINLPLNASVTPSGAVVGTASNSQYEIKSTGGILR